MKFLFNSVSLSVDTLKFDFFNIDFIDIIIWYINIEELSIVINAPGIEIYFLFLNFFGFYSFQIQFF